MGFFDWLLNSPSKVGRAVAAAVMSGDPSPFKALQGLTVPHRLEALDLAAKTLLYEEHYEGVEVVGDYAAAIDPTALLQRRLTLYRLLERTDDEVRVLETALAAQPGNPNLRERLATIYADLERPQEALDLLEAAPEEDSALELTRARVYLDLGRSQEALAIVEPLVPRLENALRGAFDDEWRMIKDRLELASGILEEVTVQREGAESAVLVAAARGRLDKGAAVNYSLIGAALMARAGADPEHLVLQPVDEQTTGDALVAAPHDLHALTDHGLTELRLLQPGKARRHFEKAHQADPGWFPAALGLGAAMRFEERGVLAGLHDLPELEVPAGLVDLAPDWPALTAEERRVVAASAQPLRALLPALVADGVVVRVLPIDVRPRDLPRLSELAGRRGGERSADSAKGLAVHDFAVARIEDLLDTTSDGSWVFAHELAHLALWRLPESWQAEVDALHAKALESPWSLGEYQQSNRDEFFAVGYEGWLRARYRRANRPQRDENGLVDGVMSLFDRLAALDSLG